jgi:hypothetical protein
MKQLWTDDKITVEQYNRAVKILKSGEKDKALDAFLLGKLDLVTFKESF